MSLSLLGRAGLDGDILVDELFDALLGMSQLQSQRCDDRFDIKVDRSFQHSTIHVNCDGVDELATIHEFHESKECILWHTLELDRTSGRCDEVEEQ